MAEERKQSPHYIPELDPDNPASGPKFKQPILRTLLASAFGLMVLGAAIFFAGYETVGLVVFFVGMALLAPVMA